MKFAKHVALLCLRRLSLIPTAVVECKKFCYEHFSENHISDNLAKFSWY